MKLIDADAVFELFKPFKDALDDEKAKSAYIQTLTLIHNAPSIDIEPKRGEWIDMGDFEQCSVCKGTHLKEFQSYYGKTTWIKTPYCPNCGADMREREGE